MILLALGLAWAAIPHAAAAQQHVRVQRLDDTYIDVFLDRGPGAAKQAVVLLLQGSGCNSIAPANAALNKLVAPTQGWAVLRIEKPGIAPVLDAEPAKPVCPSEYLQKNTIDARVLDVLNVFAHLRAEAPWWNQRAYLIGASEGATVAAVTASLAAETQGVVLINGVIGQPFREGWPDLVVAQTGAKGAEEQALRKEVAETWIKARERPTAEEVHGNTLRWWSSMIDLRPSNLLVKLNAPILLYHGDKDEMAPVASARAVAAAFEKAGKTNLTYREIPGAKHVWTRAHWNVVAPEITAFLAAQEAAAAPAAQKRERGKRTR